MTTLNYCVLSSYKVVLIVIMLQ